MFLHSHVDIMSRGKKLKMTQMFLSEWLGKWSLSKPKQEINSEEWNFPLWTKVKLSRLSRISVPMTIRTGFQRDEEGMGNFKKKLPLEEQLHPWKSGWDWAQKAHRVSWMEISEVRQEWLKWSTKWNEVLYAFGSLKKKEKHQINVRILSFDWTEG